MVDGPPSSGPPSSGPSSLGASSSGAPAAGSAERAEPGIIETSLVFGLAFLLAMGILVFFGGAVADVIGLVVDAAHQGR